jgi:hypothetical protein
MGRRPLVKLRRPVGILFILRILSKLFGPGFPCDAALASSLPPGFFSMEL